MLAIDDSSTETSVAPSAGGWITRAWSMPGQHEVVEVLVAARDLRGQVGTGQRLADEAEAVGRLERRLGVDLEVERAVADELAVGHRPAAVLRAHHAVGDLEVGDRLAEALRRQAEQRLARGGRGPAELDAAAGDAVAAAGRALVGRERGVALDHRDALERDVELLADASGASRCGRPCRGRPCR